MTPLEIALVCIGLGLPVGAFLFVVFGFALRKDDH